MSEGTAIFGVFAAEGAEQMSISAEFDLKGRVRRLSVIWAGQVE
jgi:hypothetical protein